jgi:hypothetical protein
LHDAIGSEKEWKIDLRASEARNGRIGHRLEGLCDLIGRAGDFHAIAANFHAIAEGV